MRTRVQPIDGTFRSRAVASWLNTLGDDGELIGNRHAPRVTVGDVRRLHVAKRYVEWVGEPVAVGA